MEALFALLGLVVLFPILILYDSFSWGYVATIIYTWFILPLFPQAPIFTWMQFAGIMFFISCFVHTATNSGIKKELKDETGEIVSALLRPWMLLFCAWLFRLFI